MTQFNQHPHSIEDAYQNGLLPQRNDKNSFYFESSSRSNLDYQNISSENRRILKKTSDFDFEILPITEFDYNIDVQKTIFGWLKDLKWDFPISSVKNIFTNHIFNYVYIWRYHSQICAYSVCYFDKSISHIAYVFYNPEFAHLDLPIRLSLQVIIDSQQKGLKYCYLGRFDPELKTGFYKRNFPGFEFFKNNNWQKYP